MMKLFIIGNTSREWWLIAPDEETAFDYSFQITSTKRKCNLYKNLFLTEKIYNLFQALSIHDERYKKILKYIPYEDQNEKDKTAYWIKQNSYRNNYNFYLEEAEKMKLAPEYGLYNLLEGQNIGFITCEKIRESPSYRWFLTGYNPEIIRLIAW
ncbi:hypothetical protein H6G80_29850 [Nostoc sp. FACHB-87]|uniref:hypothetical protein n=1 Tax=Nostocaceae TaxID=1162 RepID=UPI001682DD70|nr:MULTISPECIES: hypothetical protein [Nostocaceae]MBD2458257.1 hypothetical protein [Nostoc sp. FACHB-87]MBD2480103.1 hypothetical protein [Anabaena sp. FACHB-83]